MPRQKNDPNEEQIKAPEKIQLNDKEIANLKDTQFKTLVIRKLTEFIELSHKMKEEMKATQSEIKENIQGTNSEGEETGTQINSLEQKEEINIPLEQNEEIRIQKTEERIRNLWDNFKCSNIQIIRVPEGEEEKQKIENLFEQIMKENFPHLPHSILLPPLSSFVFVCSSMGSTSLGLSGLPGLPGSLLPLPD